MAPPSAGQGGPIVPPTTGGVARLDALLQHLAEPRRVLVIGAHPDDEDSGLLALVVQGYGADAAYLSLSRGEGGQNLIGTELGVALGLLRTQELLSARRVDGASQFFTRAYDFGYTRSLTETEGLWQPDSVLKDVVRVIRRFRPHVVVAVFTGTPSDGHGQHQMSGVVARRAYELAGDPHAFPELQTEEGLAPWTPLKLYASARFRRATATVQLPAGMVDPRTGRTLQQIAAESRSQHRSQDFGILQRLGPGESLLALEQTRVDATPDAGLFAGVPVDDGWLAALADSVRGVVVPDAMNRVIPALARALVRVRAEGAPRPDAERLLSEALVTAADVMLDARADRDELVTGEPVALALEVYNGGDGTVQWAGASVLPHAAGWSGTTAMTPSAGDLGPKVLGEASATVRVPDAAVPTQPYYTARHLLGAMYDWSAAPPPVRGLPDDPPPLTALFKLVVGGVPVEVDREVTYREQDQATGEVRLPVRVVPRVEVSLQPDTLLWSTRDTAPRTFTVTLRHFGTDTARGALRLAVSGWPSPPAQPYRLTRPGEEETFEVAVRRPVGTRSGDLDVHAVAEGDGARYDWGATVIDYPHIRPTVWARAASSRIRVADVQLPTARRIGYVRGASDRVPEALTRAGLPLTMLDEATLATGDLGRFEVIVIGSRAYETDSALVRHNDRLLAWVRAGGHLLVQYQQYQWSQGGFAPYPVTINRPHDRITDETSPVTILKPSHSAFQSPNRITDDDWKGWPQERGLYFAGTWDPAYEPLLQMQDPGLPPVRGGLLVAGVGKGTYVYTGLSFFRALPAGVPGAFRLFFNLLDIKGGTTP